MSINNQLISFSTEFKYLGIILDHKLNWKKHVDFVKGNAIASHNTAKRTIGKRWGLSASTAKWLYKSVVLPDITYGRSFVKNGVTYDNRNVVPYCPYLSLEKDVLSTRNQPSVTFLMK